MSVVAGLQSRVAGRPWASRPLKLGYPKNKISSVRGNVSPPALRASLKQSPALAIGAACATGECVCAYKRATCIARYRSTRAADARFCARSGQPASRGAERRCSSRALAAARTTPRRPVTSSPQRYCARRVPLRDSAVTRCRRLCAGSLPLYARRSV
jgi:hypothetical protein